MTNPDHFYLQQAEPAKSCLLALRSIILSADKEITTAWKYGMPFFCFRGKMFCYLWVQKKTGIPYVGFVEGKHLEDAVLLQEKRSRMKIWLMDPAKDIPVKKLIALLHKAIRLYKNGSIRTK
ncbi:MAG: DUF1801 domain-containing protein [Bacteroidetes bacterium]|nr:DUF1801 domain-containing protein [Bacteroidota bacterium]